MNPQTGRGYSNNKIDIHIAKTSCDGAGFSTQEYRKLIENAVDHFWNDVPISAIKLNVKDVGDIDIDGNSFDQAMEKVPANTILAGCNDAITEFSNGGSPSTILGAATMKCSGSTCTSVLILNAHADSSLPNKSASFIESVIAHEIGHAFGLGHSEDSHSLMYYSAGGKYQRWLGQDDVDGVTFLYPHESELGGLLGSCGTIETKKGSQNFLLSLFTGLLLMLALLKFTRYLRRLL